MKLEPIIKSIIDDDLYKFTQQQAVLELFPDVEVSYVFKNRGSQRFSVDFLRLFKQQIKYMEQLSLTPLEYAYIKNDIPFFKPLYVEYLKNYRFDSSEVECYLQNKDLVVTIKGKWAKTILWEVHLMAIISELYFRIMDDSWRGDLEKVMKDQTTLAYMKLKKLHKNGCIYADFGTRRRRSFDIQDNLVLIMKNLGGKPNFIGTSNLYLAMKHNVKPIGTMSHEWIMGNSVLESLRHANYRALDNWIRVYNTDLGIALTDTYGTEAFLANFNKRLARDYAGVRHDSGDPIEFTDKIIAHYCKLGIDPTTKIIIFSDGLNVDKAIEINEYCLDKIKCSFGIGTHFTNDGFENSPALNIVIKLWSVKLEGRDIPVVKLPDTPGKMMGDPDAIRVAQWTFNR